MIASSLASDDLIVDFSNVGCFTCVCTVLSAELSGKLQSLSERQRVAVVVEVDLCLACLTSVYCSNCRVLLVQPRPLHISLLLRVILFAVDFTNEIWNNFGLLIFKWSDTSSSYIVKLLEISDSLFRTWRNYLAVEIPIFSLESAHAVSIFVSWNNRSESWVSRIDWSVN